jgi:hypothetical protein
MSCITDPETRVSEQRPGSPTAWSAARKDVAGRFDRGDNNNGKREGIKRKG